MISIFGGKLTTYRVLAEEALARILRMAGRAAPRWTDASVLPGGDFAQKNLAEFVAVKAQEYDFIPHDLLQRYARSYGTRMDHFLGGVHTLEGLGECYGAGLYDAEVRYLIHHEFVSEAEDVLWRRTKTGLHMSEAELESFIGKFPALYERIKNQ